MGKPKRILIVSDSGYNPSKMFLDPTNSFAKGFIRLGHDVRTFSYRNTLRVCSSFKSKNLSLFFYKSKVDELLTAEAANYEPHIALIFLSGSLDLETINAMRSSSPKTMFIGFDTDPWPRLQRDNRIEAAKGLDILTATNSGEFLEDYRRLGVRHCAFIPNICDPDIHRRYHVSSEWRTDILWTGVARHSANSSETLRTKIVHKLTEQKNCKLYGCLGRPIISGINYLYAISGARIGISVNAVNSVRLYHSDRLTHYLAGGAFVLAKRVPDTELLFKEDVHLKYFDTIDEFFDLADWYLKHETRRKKVAEAGMQWTHEQFNCVKIAGYILDLVEKGKYSAPWNISTD